MKDPQGDKSAQSVSFKKKRFGLLIMGHGGMSPPLNLQGLSKLTKDIYEKTQNMSKIKRNLIICRPGALHTKNQPPRSKTVAYKPYFAANFDFSSSRK